MGREKIRDECRGWGCKKIVDGDYCATYLSPSYWWNKGRCPIPTVTKEIEKEFKLNPLKASKQGHKGKLILGYRLNKADYDKKLQ